MPKKYYWLKLKKDFFQSKPMKKLRKIAGGDTYTIIYLKLQLLSLERDGMLIFEGIEDNFCEELALTIDENPENVSATLCFLNKVKLLEIHSENEYILTEVPYLIGSETRQAGIMREKRKKMVENGNIVTPLGNNVTPEGNIVKKCYTELEIELENREKSIENREKSIELELDSNSIEKEKKFELMDKFKNVINLFNSTCISLSPVLTLTENRFRKFLLIEQQYENDFNYKSFFELVEKSDFLTGRNGNWNSAGEIKTNFDWIMRLDNIQKILSGRYNNKNGEEMNFNGGDKKYSAEELKIINSIGCNM